MNKWLLLTLALTSHSLWSQEMQEIDDAIKKQVMTVVKDVDVEKQLMASGEVKKCLDDNKFDTKNPVNASKVSGCFKTALEKQDPKQIAKLVDQMQLQPFGLIKSKSLNEVSTYFTKKIQRALTGVDPDEKNVKFEDRKIVDQKTYIELSLNHLSKSAIYEVSRYCFEDLRLITPPSPEPKTFIEYWSGHKTLKANIIGMVTDEEITGAPKVKKFFESNNLTDTGDKDNVYEVISNGIGANANSFNQADLNRIFNFCASAIKELCEKYTAVPNGSGAKACLTRNKLKELKTAITNTKKVLDSFSDLTDQEKVSLTVQIQNSGGLYNYGNSGKEKNLDQISTLTTDDILQNPEEDTLLQLKEKCEQESKSQMSDDCKQFLVVDDSLAKADHALIVQNSLKKESEIVRLEKMSKEEQKKYLEENHYYDLLALLEEDKLDIRKEVSAIYDAKLKAEQQAIQNSVGKRQISESTFNDNSFDTQQAVGDAITETREEKSRLAQVVLFNNIISSSIAIEDDKGNSLGSNTTAWIEENERLQNAGGVDTKLFKNISTQASQAGKSNSISDNKIIDMILGKDP